MTDNNFGCGFFISPEKLTRFPTIVKERVNFKFSDLVVMLTDADYYGRYRSDISGKDVVFL